MPKKVDAIIIGTGQSGPSLAGRFSQEGQSVAIIERKKFGGSCLNYGCTPTKTLVYNAKAAHTVRIAKKYGIHVENFSIDMKKVKQRKDEIVKESSEGLEKWLKSLKNCTVIEGHASFVNPHRVQVKDEVIEAEKIFINVGARARIPKIPGLDKVPYLTNSSLLEIDFLPEHLLIIGGGYIGLEFAQIYRRLGSRVTIFQRQPYVMPKEDNDVCLEIRRILEKEEIEILTDVRNLVISEESRENSIEIILDQGGDQKRIRGSHLLLATGRIPNTEDLGLQNAGITLDKGGFITVDETLRTNVSHIWAIGECNGRGAFTHTSYNDFEIVSENLFNHGSRKASDRIPIYALFTDPPLGKVGMGEKDLKDSPYHVLVGKMPMTRVARAREMGETDGFLKIFVDKDTQLILGAVFLGVHCDEVIQTIADIMYAKAPYTVIQNGVHIHSTVMELVPTLLSELKPLKQHVEAH